MSKYFTYINIFCSINIIIEILTQARWYRLTSNEIAAGLKPLVIKIHPDLYANYPDIQEVNSRSLSSLQSWLDQLNDQTPDLQKLPVSFYLKRKDNKPRSVSVLLEPTEIREALSLGMIIKKIIKNHSTVIIQFKVSFFDK